VNFHVVDSAAAGAADASGECVKRTYSGGSVALYAGGLRRVSRDGIHQCRRKTIVRL
jgi:hypothetical protein